jgi:hypothetical protein
MSARQPFMFGGSRPPSRLGQPADAENNGKDDKNDADTTEVQPQNQNNSFPALNLSSLTRKKSSASQHQNNSTQSNNINQQTRSSIENLIPPGVDAIVARPRGKQTSPPAAPANLRLQPLRVAAPRPSVPSAFFSVTTVPFKLPSLPGSKRPPSTLPQAHTSTETDFLDTNSGAAGLTVNSAFVSDAQAIVSGSAVDAHKTRSRPSSHARMLGKIVETDLEREMELELESQSQSHEGVLEHPFGSSGPGRLVADHPTDAPVGEGRPGRTLKRSKQSFSFEGDATRDGGEEEDYGTLTKRFKADDVGCVLLIYAHHSFDFSCWLSRIVLNTSRGRPSTMASTARWPRPTSTSITSRSINISNTKDKIAATLAVLPSSSRVPRHWNSYSALTSMHTLLRIRKNTKRCRRSGARVA